MNTKNIIFDLGGVVIDLDRSRAVQALESLGVADADVLLGEYEQKGPFLLLETGKVTVAEFYDNILSLCRRDTTCTEVQDAFERFLVGLPVARLERIRALRAKGYKVYVLSNTNPLMYNHWIDLAFRQEGLTINDYFDGIVTSFQERVCKPDPNIFRVVYGRYGLDPSETLMLDDSAANCAAARSVGYEAIQITKTGDTGFESVTSRLLENAPLK